MSDMDQNNLEYYEGVDVEDYNSNMTDENNSGYNWQNSSTGSVEDTIPDESTYDQEHIKSLPIPVKKSSPPGSNSPNSPAPSPSSKYSGVPVKSGDNKPSIPPKPNRKGPVAVSPNSGMPTRPIPYPENTGSLRQVYNTSPSRSIPIPPGTTTAPPQKPFKPQLPTEVLKGSEKCGRCEQNSASIICGQCDIKYFCTGCSDTVHSGKWKSHPLTFIVSTPGEEPSSPPPVTREAYNSARSLGSSKSVSDSMATATRTLQSSNSDNSVPKVVQPISSPTPSRGRIGIAGTRVSAYMNPDAVAAALAEQEAETTKAAALQAPIPPPINFPPPVAHQPTAEPVQPQFIPPPPTTPAPQVATNNQPQPQPVVQQPTKFVKQAQSPPLNSNPHNPPIKATQPRTQSAPSLLAKNVFPPPEKNVVKSPPMKAPIKTGTGSVNALAGKLFGDGKALPGMGPPPTKIVRTARSAEALVPSTAPAGTQGKPSAPIIQILVPDRNVTVNKMFPEATAVKQLSAWVMGQVLQIPAPEKKEKGREYYHVFLNGKRLDEDKLLLHYGISRDRPVTLELRPVVYDEMLVKTRIMDAGGSHVTVLVKECTTGWYIVSQVLKKLHVRGAEWTLPAPPDDYELRPDNSRERVDEDTFVLEERERISGGQLNFVAKSKSEAGQAEGPLQRLHIVYTEEINVEMSFPANTTCNNALKTFVKTYVLKKESPNLWDFGFEIPPLEEGEQGVWMEPNDLLSKHPDDVTVIFRKRVREYTIGLPDGNTFCLSFDHSATVQDCLNVIAYNTPEVMKDISISEWMLALQKDGTALIEERTLASYDITSTEILQFRRKLYPLLVFAGDLGQRMLYVDYTTPAGKIIDMIWKAFGIPAQKEGDYKFRRISPDVSIDQNKSLASQNVEKNSTVMVKLLNYDTQREDVVSVNIWVEPAANISYDTKTKELLAASFNKLIEKLTDEQNDNPELLKAFLYTYPSFASANNFLAKLIERYYVPTPPNISIQDLAKFQSTTMRSIQKRVCAVLKEWLNCQFQDMDHDLIQQVVNFIDNLPPEFTTTATQLQQGVLSRNCGLKTVQKAKRNLKNAPESIIRHRATQSNTTLSRKAQLDVQVIPNSIFEFDELEIARQLSLIEFEYFESVMPSELLGQSWSKPKTQHLSQNLLKMINRLNDVSLWVASSILEPARVKLRASRFDKLIKIAFHLKSMNNFSTLMAFLGGFSNAAVNRLKFTKQLLSKSSGEANYELERLMSVEGSYKNYRENLKVAQLSPPLIPYMGAVLSDLTFIDEGNPDLVGNNLINIYKWILTYRQIEGVMKCQQWAYNYKEVTSIARFIRAIPSRDEKTFNGELYQISISREPRNAEKVV